MTTTKTVNYTPEMTAELVSAYVANPVKSTVEAFALKFGKNVKSITAKLSREGVYVKAIPTAKDGSVIIAKEELADAIGKVLPALNENDISSLTKANKNALKVIFEALANSKPIDGNE